MEEESKEEQELEPSPEIIPRNSLEEDEQIPMNDPVSN
jgi:hypothetical protein